MKNKRFAKDRVFTLFDMPINFGKVMKRLYEKIRKAGANIPDWLYLCDHTSKWNMDFYLAIDKEPHDAENTTLSGKFLSKVYEGPFKDTKKWSDNLYKYSKKHGYMIKK